MSISDSKSLALGVIGCGMLTESYYAPALSGLSIPLRIVVAAAVDPNQGRRDLFGRLFPQARDFVSLCELPKGTVDACIVASPPRFHAEQVLELADKGVHVLCEKPMSADKAEADAMVSAARKKGIQFAVGHFRRLFPSSRQIRDLIRDESLGHLREVYWVEGGVFNWGAATPSFFQKSGSSGGVLADVGSHVLDLLRWWLGEPSELAYEDDAMGGLETNCRVRLGFPGGVRATVRLSRDTDLPTRTVLRFEKGWVSFKGASADQIEMGFHGTPLALDARIVQKVTPAAPAAASETYAQAFMAQIQNFCAAIRGTEALVCPGEDAAKTQGLIEACYANRRLMAQPWLSAEEVAGIQRVLGQGRAPA